MNRPIDPKHLAKIAAIIHQRITQPTVAESVETAIKIIQEAQAVCEKLNGGRRAA